MSFCLEMLAAGKLYCLIQDVNKPDPRKILSAFLLGGEHVIKLVTICYI